MIHRSHVKVEHECRARAWLLLQGLAADGVIESGEWPYDFQLTLGDEALLAVLSLPGLQRVRLQPNTV